MTEGGTAWELATAIRLMGEAVASGDPEQIATAMRRHAEALSNQSLTVLVPTLEKTLHGVVAPAVTTLTAAIESIKAHQDQRFTYVLRQLEAEFKTNAAWRDKWADEIQALGASVKELDMRHAAQWRLVMNRLDTDQQRLDRKRREIDEIKGEIEILKDRLAKIEGRSDGAQS